MLQIVYGVLAFGLFGLFCFLLYAYYIATCGRVADLLHQVDKYKKGR